MHSKNQIIGDKVLTLLNQVKANYGEPITPLINLNLSIQSDLGFDSLKLAELAVLSEAEFGVDAFANGIPNTVGELISKILKLSE